MMAAARLSGYDWVMLNAGASIFLAFLLMLQTSLSGILFCSTGGACHAPGWQRVQADGGQAQQVEHSGEASSCGQHHGRASITLDRMHAVCGDEAGCVSHQCECIDHMVVAADAAPGGQSDETAAAARTADPSCDALQVLFHSADVIRSYQEPFPPWVLSKQGDVARRQQLLVVQCCSILV